MRAGTVFSAVVQGGKGGNMLLGHKAQAGDLVDAGVERLPFFPAVQRKLRSANGGVPLDVQMDFLARCQGIKGSIRPSPRR